MDKCLFCDCDLDPGSEEHVFLSALGGRVATYRGSCQVCNNAFAGKETGKIDDALAESFEAVRNGLKIWTGRKAPPPTLLKAGAMPDGAEYDLAPGFVVAMRPGRLPSTITPGTEHVLVARDEADAKRLLEILGKRGTTVELGKATRVRQKAPETKVSFAFDGPKVWRTVAKTAVVGFVVLYGNEQARRHISSGLRAAIRYGAPSIENFAGWDFSNEWPAVQDLAAHARTPDARPSGYEHSLVVADVAGHCVAYVTLFGGWRFSVLLGPATGLPTRGLAVNPRDTRPARFVLSAQAPAAYAPRQPGSFQSEFELVLEHNRAAMTRAMQTWSEEAHADYAEKLTGELEAEIEAAGDDPARRQSAIEGFAEKLAVVEHGGSWSTDLETVFDEDAGALRKPKN